jgi:hypothetical protein
MKNDFLKLPDKVFGINIDLIGVFLIPLVVIVVFIISLGVVILPKINQIGDLNQNIASVKNQIKSTSEKKSYLLSIDQEQLKRDESYLDSAVLKEKNSYLLVGVIRRVCDSFGFQVKSFAISPGKLKDDTNQTLKVSDKDVAVKMPVDLVLSGPSDKSLDLIKALENSLPILFIDKLDTKTFNGTSDLDMTIASYYVPNKTDLVSGNLTLDDLKPTQEETTLLTTISKFQKIDELTSDQDNSGGTFVEYDRSNPFAL